MADPWAAWLRQRGLISEEQLTQALEKQRISGLPLGRVCVALGFVKETALLEALAESLGLERYDLGTAAIPPEVIGLVPAALARGHRLVPVALRGETLLVAMADPWQLTSLDDLRFATGHPVQAVVASPAQIEEALERYYSALGLGEAIGGVLSDRSVAGSSAELSVAGSLSELQRQAAGIDLSSAAGGSADLKALANQAPVVRLVDMVLTEAVARKASDVHIEPFEEELLFRYRVDGACDVVARASRSLSAAVISRVKVLANLDVAESRLPQDGRIMATIAGRQVDLRVSTLPTVFGESVVLRVLDRGAVQLSLEQLGIDEGRRRTLEALVRRPHGMLLVTGPTGSGKTTTLYSCLRLLNRPEVKVITTEDPVEYDIAGIMQVAINAKIELSFARCLRSILRQDPDIIMVGEIRDEETAQIAVQSSLTGHLVLSTLHTNDAPSAVTRLMDMGVEPFLITSTVQAVLAQRLVRRLCPSCRRPREVSAAEAADLGVTSGTSLRAWQTDGCAECRQSGVHGRTGLYELMVFSDPIRRAVLERVPLGELRRIAQVEGMVPLRQDGMQKIQEGVTTVEEVLRETQG